MYLWRVRSSAKIVNAPCAQFLRKYKPNRIRYSDPLPLSAESRDSNKASTPGAMGGKCTCCHEMAKGFIYEA